MVLHVPPRFGEAVADLNHFTSSISLGRQVFVKNGSSGL
jgi:hypothetical protein